MRTRWERRECPPEEDAARDVVGGLIVPNRAVDDVECPADHGDAATGRGFVVPNHAVLKRQGRPVGEDRPTLLLVPCAPALQSQPDQGGDRIGPVPDTHEPEVGQVVVASDGDVLAETVDDDILFEPEHVPQLDGLTLHVLGERDSRLSLLDEVRDVDRFTECSLPVVRRGSRLRCPRRVRPGTFYPPTARRRAARGWGYAVGRGGDLCAFFQLRQNANMAHSPKGGTCWGTPNGRTAPILTPP